ncbi:MAG: class I SAM-dependent methyltransferase [bacterium]
MRIVENVYGHGKRLEFIFTQIQKYLSTHNISQEEFKILDVGCGTGVMITLPIAAAGYNICGVDSDKDSIKLANKLNTFTNASFIHGLVEKRNFEETFDVIICSEVLEHQRNPYSFIRRLKEILKNEGLLIITVPNGYGLFEIDKFFWDLFNKIIPHFGEVIPAIERRVKRVLLNFFFMRKEKIDKDEWEVPSTLCFSKHYCKFTYLSITNLLRRAGFKIISSSNSSLWAGLFANCLMRDFKGLIFLNSQIVDFLPPFLASGWYFSCQKGKI